MRREGGPRGLGTRAWSGDSRKTSAAVTKNAMDWAGPAEGVDGPLIQAEEQAGQACSACLPVCCVPLSRQGSISDAAWMTAAKVITTSSAVNSLVVQWTRIEKLENVRCILAHGS